MPAPVFNHALAIDIRDRRTKLLAPLSMGATYCTCPPVLSYLNEKLGEVNQEVLQDARRWEEAKQRDQLELRHEPANEQEHVGG